MRTAIAVITFCLAFANGFLFDRRDPDEIKQIAQKDVLSDCLQQSTNGDCNFYTCIENRFPCGRDGYASRFGRYYCQRIKNNINSLNAGGRVWANATLKCQTQALKTLYQSAAQSCRAIYNAGFDAMHQCFIENKFCDINWDNRDAIWEIFDATDLNPGSTASRKMWGQVLKVSGSCISQKANQFADWLRERTENIGQVIEDFFRGIFDKIKKAI